MSDPNLKSARCPVCGYVHHGPEPPAFCPVCGAPGDDFEAIAAERPRNAAAAPPTRFRCLNCGYERAGGAPPDTCPVCGAAEDRFEAVAASGAGGTGGDGLRIVVVGGGIAGLSAIEALRDHAPEARVALVAREAEPPYYRLNLTRWLAGEIGRGELPLHPPDWYRTANFEHLAGGEAVALDLAARTVRLRDGGTVPYDRLILACGAHPFLPPFPGAYRDGVMSLRTLADAERILARARPGAPVVCIGGGILGLEAAGALLRRGVEVTLVESYPWLLSRQLDRRAGELLEARLRDLGIRTITGAKVEELPGDEAVRGVALAGRAPLPADLVLVTAGVRPNSYLARQAGLRVNQGIAVDRHLSCAPGVYAAGDVAEFEGTVYGLWNPARYMGGIAGMNAAGIATEFGGIPRSNTLKVLDLDLFSVGRVAQEDGGDLEAVLEEDGRYARFLMRDGRLVGAVLLGDATLGIRAKAAVEARTDLSAVCGGGARPDVRRLIDLLRG